MTTYLEHGEHLARKGLALEPRLVRRLPAELARRFHALPLAEERGRITVAMADPDDPVARQAVSAVLGPSACVVRCDAQAIDSLLAEIWGAQDRQPLRVLACAPSARTPSHGVAHYAELLSSLLEASLDCVSLDQGASSLDRKALAGEYDLCILPEAAHPLLQRLLSSPLKMENRDREGSLWQAALVVREPRWPIARILLVLCGQKSDRMAVDWVLHLAHRAHSEVTVLTIVPPVPAMYGHRPSIGDGLPALLTANSPLGQQMRQVARNLVAWEIEATLCLREGPPDIQIRRELAQGDYDLVALANRPCSPTGRWLKGDEANDALRCTDRPVLIPRPAT